MKCLKRTFSRCKPEIINSDQGSHFTNPDYPQLLEKEGIKVSTDGKGRVCKIKGGTYDIETRWQYYNQKRELDSEEIPHDRKILDQARQPLLQTHASL